jgi:carboxypeptidase Taq
MSINKEVEAFKSYTGRIEALGKASMLYHWDSATGAPKKAVKERTHVMGLLDTEAFLLLISDEMRQHLEFLEVHSQELDPITLKIFKYYKYEYDKKVKIPKEEYHDFSVLCARSSNVWENAKATSNFSMFEPYLEKVVHYKRRFIDYYGWEGHPYNTLLNDFEPGMTVKNLDEFFDVIKKEIVPMVHKITSQKEKSFGFIKQVFPKGEQKKFSHYLLEKLLYDKEKGELKESEHPFTLAFSRNDVRITTHYYEDQVLSAIASTIHEAGHAIYEQSIDEKYLGTILEAGTSMGIHESQSRFYENMIGKSLSFWKLLLPKAKEIFPGKLDHISEDDFYEAINIIKPSLIRIESDELTYSLHILVRYEIEKQLIKGDIEVKDLPKYWADLMEEYLGVVPQNDGEGVLQDIHWSEGSFGYFPSYALGNAYAAQFLMAMNKEFDVNKSIEKGDFYSIKNWLNKNVHQYGKFLDPNEIIKKATGEDLNPKYLVDYFKEKYSKLYDI